MSRLTYALLFAGLCVLASQPVRAEETAKKEPAPAAAPAPKSQNIDDDTQKKMNDTLNKMTELDKQWSAERTKTVNSKEMTKEEKKRIEERKKTEDKEAKERKKSEEKGGKTAYRSSGASDSGVSGQYASNSSGGWVEAGGVTHSSSYSSSGGGGSVRESSYGGTSIGVRTTVIRLE
jgi:hypothetical protein